MSIAVPIEAAGRLFYAHCVVANGIDSCPAVTTDRLGNGRLERPFVFQDLGSCGTMVADGRRCPLEVVVPPDAAATEPCEPLIRSVALAGSLSSGEGDDLLDDVACVAAEDEGDVVAAELGESAVLEPCHSALRTLGREDRA